MNMKTIGFSAAILIFGMAAGFLIRGNSGTGQPVNALQTESTQRNVYEIGDPVAGEDAVPVESEQVADWPQDLLAESNSPNEKGPQTERPSPDSEPLGRGLKLEEALIRGNSLDAATLTSGPDNDERFDRLMSELRQDTSPIAAQKRMEYELKLYSQPLTRDGSVTIDTFECGERICAAELRAGDPATFGKFVQMLVDTEDFEPKAVVALMGKPNTATPNSQVTRLIFSHDLTVDSISVSRLALRDED